MTGERWWMLLILMALVSLVTRSQVLAFLTVLLGLGSLVSLLSFRYGTRGITYRRRFGSNRIFCGEVTDLAIEVTNARPLPLPWLLVRDRFPDGLSLAGEGAGEEGAGETPGALLRDLLVLRWYESVERTYAVRGLRRGVYSLDDAELAWGSLFGLEEQRAFVTRVDRLVVYPKVVPVEALELPFERPAGLATAVRPIVEDPLRLATVRDYVPGDSVRHIHWKNTAHRNQLQTKVFDPEASEVLLLYTDVQTAYDPYAGVSEYLELAISAAASLTVHALDARRSVGLLVNGGPPETNGWTFVPPSRHPQQGPQILESLAVLDGFRTLPLSQLILRSMGAIPFGSTAVVITARTTEPVLLALLSLQDAGHATVLLTIGEQPPSVPERFTTYHLGGRDAWHRLETLALAR